MNFREYITEKTITTAQVSKVIKNVKLDILSPEFFELSIMKYSGGGQSVLMRHNKPRPKDKADIELVMKAIETNFKIEKKDDTIVIFNK